MGIGGLLVDQRRRPKRELLASASSSRSRSKNARMAASAAASGSPSGDDGLIGHGVEQLRGRTVVDAGLALAEQPLGGEVDRLGRTAGRRRATTTRRCPRVPGSRPMPPGPRPGVPGRRTRRPRRGRLSAPVGRVDRGDAPCAVLERRRAARRRRPSCRSASPDSDERRPSGSGLGLRSVDLGHLGLGQLGRRSAGPAPSGRRRSGSARRAGGGVARARRRGSR